MKRATVELPKDTMSSTEEMENIKILFQHQYPFIISKGWKTQILSTYGVSSKECYGALYRSKEGIESFFRYMDEAWGLRGKEVVSAFDLSDFQLICDLSGSSGGLAKELISKYPNCTVKLFDLPEIVDISKEYNAFSDDSLITFHEGDFFKDPIPEADLYILSRVLFNWNDEKCIQLLTKVFAACKPGCGVLIVEPTVDEEISGSFPGHMYAMILLLQTIGKPWKVSEHRMLFNTAGFKDIQFKKRNVFDVIMIIK